MKACTDFEVGHRSHEKGEDNSGASGSTAAATSKSPRAKEAAAGDSTKDETVAAPGGRTSPPLFFVTLCVGLKARALTCLSPVSGEVLDFLLNEWLPRVPEEEEVEQVPHTGTGRAGGRGARH